MDWLAVGSGSDSTAGGHDPACGHSASLSEDYRAGRAFALSAPWIPRDRFSRLGALAGLLAGTAAVCFQLAARSVSLQREFTDGIGWGHPHTQPTSPLVIYATARYAYYDCWRQCRAVNIDKAKLEGLFVDELKQLQPSAGYMRLVREHVLLAWEQRKAEICRDVAGIERRAKAIQQKLDRLDEAFPFAQSIDVETYDRHKDRLRHELTLLDIGRHSSEVEKFDVESILAFAGRVLPRASDLWVQASLEQRQRLQHLFFPDAVAFDGKRYVRTGVSTHTFKYLTPVQPAEKNLASLMPASWNQITQWLRNVDGVRKAA